MDMLWLILFQILLIALNAIFACAEIAVLSTNETKLERMSEQGNSKAKRLFKLTREPAKFLATIQVAITLSGFLGSAFAADNFSEPLVNWVVSLGIGIPRSTLDAVAVIVITLILSYFTLVFGELVPKRVAMKKSEQLAMGISGLVSFISVAFKPIVWFLSVSTNIVLRIMGIDPNEAEDEVSEEEIRMMVDSGSEKGTIDHQEKELIQNVFEFNDIAVGEIATHRIDITMLDTEDSDEEWARIIHESRHNRYPVCNGSPDDIIGILNVRDYYRLADKSRESVMKNAVYPAYFVPEMVKADVVFRNMKKTHNSFAVIMDEYGGIEGIITFNDLVAELVGEMNDEQDESTADEPCIEKIADFKWQITGNILLRDIEKELGIELEYEDYDTFTGLVFDKLGRIPEDNETDVELAFDDLVICVKKMDGHQIESATLEIVAKADEQEE